MTPDKSYPIGGTCKRGHPWETSAYIKKNGHRFCKVCNYESTKARWRLNMKQPDRALEPLERFHKRLDKTTGQGPQGTCWCWKGTTTNGGYGILSVDGAYTRTHRFAWELANGPIPDDLHVLHHCDNPPCCNPDHLFLGTDADNANDRVAKGRSPDMKAVSLYRLNPVGERNGRAKFTWEIVRSIRADHAAYGCSYSELAETYNMSGTNVYRIVRNKTWKEEKNGQTNQEDCGIGTDHSLGNPPPQTID